MLNTVESLLRLDDELLARAYTLYAHVFEEINELAAQRHLLTHAEFSDVATDPRIIKLLAYDSTGNLNGIATITNTLEAWPLISPPFYRRLFPNHYARQAIWYVGFVGVRPRTPHVFRALVSELFTHVRSNDGVVAMDFCTFNQDVLDMPHRTLAMLKGWHEGSRVQKMDAQTTWLYEFDGPAPAAAATQP